MEDRQERLQLQAAAVRLTVDGEQIVPLLRSRSPADRARALEPAQRCERVAADIAEELEDETLGDDGP